MMHRARRQLLLAVAYLASLAVPCLHSLSDVEVECTECELRLERGPWLEASCDGGAPCEDPSHHHHHAHGHDHGQCPTCQGKLHGIEAGLDRWELAVLAVAPHRPSRHAGVVSCVFARTPPARGPPAIS